MDDFIDLICDELSYKTVMVGALVLLGYLWKHYEKFFKVFIRQSTQSLDALHELRSLVQNTEYTRKTIEDSLDDLNVKIEGLEDRLNVLEKALIESNTTDKEILRDVEGIRKSIEILQIIKTMSRGKL
jgi:septal ring factor EnvC (AmiA/AmiB activator)